MKLKEMDDKYIVWINTGRGICMLCVFIAHCNFYYLNNLLPIFLCLGRFIYRFSFSCLVF